jgi:ribulose-bisphosphate carboxylase small chain
MFETFSYLPPLSDDQIARQVDYIVNNGWTPCLEFSEPELAYVSSASCSRMGAVSSVSNLSTHQDAPNCAATCLNSAPAAKFPCRR